MEWQDVALVVDHAARVVSDVVRVAVMDLVRIAVAVASVAGLDLAPASARAPASITYGTTCASRCSAEVARGAAMSGPRS